MPTGGIHLGVSNVNDSTGWHSNRSQRWHVYSEKKIIAVTKLKIMKLDDYGHLDEIEVRTEDQHLYTFKEGGFPHLRLQDIKDMLLLLFQQKLTNLMIEEHYDFECALPIFEKKVNEESGDVRSVERLRDFAPQAVRAHGL
ncbi:hypothetical protein Tco_0359804 [Tanacetum coccineum]